MDVADGPVPADEVLGRLAGLAGDPAFVGYPYPLARAHQAARVTGYAVADPPLAALARRRGLERTIERYLDLDAHPSAEAGAGRLPEQVMQRGSR